MPHDSVPLLLISGPPGVGKSTVAWEIFDRLVHSGESPALADLDLLGASWPVPPDDPYNERMRAANLAAVWANYQRAGSRCLIVDGVIESRKHREAYEAAIPHAVAVLCRLEAGEDQLGSRIVRRGRERGDGIAKLTHRAIELSAQLGRADGADLTVDTDGRDVGEVADQILHNTGWPRRSSG